MSDTGCYGLNIITGNVLQEKITRASRTNSFHTISTPVNTASASMTFSPVGPLSRPSFVPFGGSFPIDVANLPHDPLMPKLEDTAEIRSTGIFGNAFDDHDLETLNTPYADQNVGAEADFNNMEPSTIVSPIPTTRVHSIHPKAQIIGDPKEGQITKISKTAYLLVSFLNMNPQRYLKPLMMKVGLKQSGFVDLEFLEKVYKVEKALYGLHQAPRAWLMIGSLMYLTSSRPDIMFSVCACSRFQVQPKVSHLNAVKRIFRYLKVTMQVPAWTGNLQQEVVNFLVQGKSLGSVKSKRWWLTQLLKLNTLLLLTAVTKIHVDNESAICVAKNPVYHSKTKHIEIQHHFIRDSYEKRLIEMVKIHTDYNVADLLTKAFDMTRFQFLITSIDKKELAIPGQTATGKEFSNLLMADSLPKTILPTTVFGMT
ncbi:hypothetical protein Tco_0708349 [Tanacetum coccineum]